MKPAFGLVLVLLVACWLSVSNPPDSPLVAVPLVDECTAGVADGDVTVDGRPLLWKLRNETDQINDVHYFPAGIEHYAGLGPAAYSYLGMGPTTDTPGPVRQGINAQGLALGWNVLDSSGWQVLNHQSLGHFSAVSQVRAYINGMTDLSTFNYFSDAGGEAAMWENQLGADQHWEYNTRSPARDVQGIDIDNADGDGNPWTGVDVTYSGWVVRANGPAHFNSDGSDDLVSDGRYGAGRDVVAKLIYNDGNGTKLSAPSLAREFFRNDELAIDSTVSNMIVHGVLPTEDPRLSTMWTMLGHSETGIFVPVWLHGVEYAGQNLVPAYLNNDDDGVCVYSVARGMYNAGFQLADVQARTLPFEEHLFQVVDEVLLPEWRAQDWTDPIDVANVGAQMKRVQEQMDADAYGHLRYLYENGAASNYAPTIEIDDSSHAGLAVTLSITASDLDGSTGGGRAALIDLSPASGTVSNPETTPIPGRYWNTLVGPAGGYVTNALWSDGSQSAIDVVITNAFAGQTPNGSGAVLYPGEAQTDAFFAGEGAGYNDAAAQLEIRDLDPNKLYRFTFFASRNSHEYDRRGDYSIDGQTVTLDAYNNTDQVVSISNVSPDVAGSVVVDIQKHATGDGFAYLNVLDIRELDDSGSGLTTSCDFGDGHTSSSTTHVYSEPGRYLVSCTATDERGVSQTDWLFTTVGDEATCHDGVQNQGETLIDCGGPCPPCACLSDGECDDGLFCSGSETCDAFGRCLAGSAPCASRACDEDLDVCFPGLARQYAWNMDSDPGWSSQGLWAWGHPVGAGGQYGRPDPTAGYSGVNVIGYNLSGDYESNLPETHLTSTAIDCSDLSGVTLHFRRWLNVEQPRYDHAYLRASNDGISWTTIWENGAEIVDTAWTPQVFDLSGLADGRPGLYLRWTMGTTDASWRYSGWNIDDVEIWAESTVPPPNHTPVADDLAVSTEEDHSLNLSLSASDQDGDALSYVIVTPPAYGMLTGTAPDLVYAPLQDFYGSDGFTYRANDGQADSNTAVVSITVIPVNDAPIAASQVVTTAQDAELHITLTASDVDGDPLTFSVIDEPDHGALSGSGQELTYRPNPDYFGPDSFAFRAHDGLAESNTAAVGITVLSGKPKLMLPIVLCSMR